VSTKPGQVQCLWPIAFDERVCEPSRTITTQHRGAGERPTALDDSDNENKRCKRRSSVVEVPRDRVPVCLQITQPECVVHDFTLLKKRRLDGYRMRTYSLRADPQLRRRPNSKQIQSRMIVPFRRLSNVAPEDRDAFVPAVAHHIALAFIVLRRG
jgi:hypothetical protein